MYNVIKNHNLVVFETPALFLLGDILPFKSADNMSNNNKNSSFPILCGQYILEDGEVT